MQDATAATLSTSFNRLPEDIQHLVLDLVWPNWPRRARNSKVEVSRVVVLCTPQWLRSQFTVLRPTHPATQVREWCTYQRVCRSWRRYFRSKRVWLRFTDGRVPPAVEAWLVLPGAPPATIVLDLAPYRWLPGPELLQLL